MRIRKLLIATIVAALACFAFTGAAAAAGLREPAGHAEEECIEILEDGGSVDDCQEAPSPILPATNELIWGIISFVVLLFLMWKFAYPGIKKGMDARSDRIRKSVEDADEAKSQSEATLEQYRAQLADAKNEAARIVEEARQQADALKREREAALQGELGAMRERAAADIESSKAQAVADLRSEVARLAIGAAEVVVQRNLDSATQTQLVENYIEQVGVTGVTAKDRIEGYATALFEVARAEGSLDEVEDELFRFARTLEGSDELRNVLIDEAIPAGRREAIVEELLGGKASPVTASLVSFVVGAGRARDLPAIIDQLVERAAAEKQLVVAEVRSAIPLTEDQEARLADALSNATGKKVQLHVVVDPAVLGGLVASVGDTVIDGTVRDRLSQLKSLL